MTFANPVGGVIVQSGTDTDLSGLVGVTGVTVTALTHWSIYDLGTNRLQITGTLTINGSDGGDKETLVVGVDGGTQEVDIDITSTGTLNVGRLATQSVDYATERFWPSIFEDAAIDFTDGNGNISNDGGTTDAFINVEGDGTLNWYGCINCTGGMRFKGVNDGSSTAEANITIRGGVLDARRQTERNSGESDQFIYNYSDNLDIAIPSGMKVGFTVVTGERTGTGSGDEAGLAIIQLGEPISLQGYESVFSSQALGGSNSASSDLAYTVTDYTGIIGHPTNNIDLRSASIASNTSTITFLNSDLGSTLRLATQDPGFEEIEALQSVTGTLTDALGANRVDAIMATENKNSVVTSDLITAGAFDLGNILLATWDDGNPPVATFNNPSNTNDDLWSFFVYSYLGEDRSRIDVLLRGAGGTAIDFISADDTDITETNRLVVDAYTSINDLSQLYDRSKSFKISTSNVNKPSLDTPIAVGAGDTVDLGALDLVIDGTAVAAYAYNDVPTPDVVTISTNKVPSVLRVGATTAVVEDPEDDEITVAFPAGIVDDDVAYLIIGHAESEDNAWNTPSGWTIVSGLTEVQTGGTPASIPGVTVFRRVLSSDSGNVTVTNAGVNVSGIVGQMIVYRDVDTTTPEDVTPTTATGTTGDPDPPSITPVNDDSMILVVGFGDTEQTVDAVPSGYTAINDTVTVDGGDEGNRTASPVVDTFTTVGADTFVVPAGVTTITMKCWGAGGGGGGGGSSVAGAVGGGGGFAAGDVTVTPGETLNLFVGGGGGLGGTGGAAEGGGGGGETSIVRATGLVDLMIAGAGGGGGGGDNSGGAAAAGRGGAGGAATGETGVGSGTSTGGGGGTTSAGGAAGTGNESGSAGSASAGGNGGDDDGTAGGTGNGGTGGGGEGGNSSAGFGAGGGGGHGRFGGGGGGSAQASVGSGTGGGGGSNLVTGASTTNSQGSAGTGAGQGDGDYPANTGNGGAGGAIDTNGVAGQRGAIVLRYTPPGTSLDGMTMSTAELKQGTAAAENPGAFDFNESEEWGAITIAIRVNQSGSSSTALTASSKFSQLTSTGTFTVANGATVNGLTFNGDVILEDVVDLTDVTINGDLEIQTAGTYAFSNVTVTGDTTNSDAAGNVRINASNGTSVTTSEPGTGNGLVDIVNTVTVRVTVLDASTLLPIEGARVLVEADTGGPLAAGTDILNALTNVSGVVEDTAFSYTADQPIVGRVAKGTVSPVYKPASITGDILNTGFSTNVFLTLDE